MRPYPAFIFFLVSFVCIPVFSQAQDDDFPTKKIERLNGRLMIEWSLPGSGMRPAMKNNMGNSGFGASFAILSNPASWCRQRRNSPLRLGVDAGYTYFGRFLSEVSVNGYRGNYKTSYGILHANAVLQLRPALADRIMPYLEVLGGGNFYLSNTKQDLSAIETGLGVHGFDIGSYASAGFNKGLALGASFGRPGRNSPQVSVRMAYHWGDRLRYIVRNSLVYNPGSGSLEYFVAEAPVRYFLFQIGLAL